ncbi:hypothetical protein KIPB_002342 [Kipferlia bialata]|uniref:Uncharacterized protein n=1 Tax=Kipferlia bialata TaxID=797122 RepID=A0A9K3CRB1_9EUKA|nr:hypothetical protein KIPB_002342 [Kipferlia bialata]|eukprot:g2342.t1
MGIRGFYGALNRSGCLTSVRVCTLRDRHLLVDLSALKFALVPLLGSQYRWTPLDVAQQLEAFFTTFSRVVVVKDGAVGATPEQLRKREDRFTKRIRDAREAGQWLLRDPHHVPNFLSRVMDDALQDVLGRVASEHITAPSEADHVLIDMALRDRQAAILTGDTDMCKVATTVVWAKTLYKTLLSLKGGETESARVSVTDSRSGKVKKLLHEYHQPRVTSVTVSPPPVYTHQMTGRPLPHSFLSVLRQGLMSNTLADLVAQGIATNQPGIECTGLHSPCTAVNVRMYTNLANMCLCTGPLIPPGASITIGSYLGRQPDSIHVPLTGTCTAVSNKGKMVETRLPTFTDIYPETGTLNTSHRDRFVCLAALGSMDTDYMDRVRDPYDIQRTLLLSIVAREVLDGGIAPYRLLSLAMLLGGVKPIDGAYRVTEADTSTYALLNVCLPIVRAYLSMGPDRYTPALYPSCDHRTCLALSAQVRTEAPELCQLQPYSVHELYAALTRCMNRTAMTGWENLHLDSIPLFASVVKEYP